MHISALYLLLTHLGVLGSEPITDTGEETGSGVTRLGTCPADLPRPSRCLHDTVPCLDPAPSAVDSEKLGTRALDANYVEGTTQHKTVTK